MERKINFAFCHYRKNNILLKTMIYVWDRVKLDKNDIHNNEERGPRDRGEGGECMEAT